MFTLSFNLGEGGVLRCRQSKKYPSIEFKQSSGDHSASLSTRVQFYSHQLTRRHLIIVFASLSAPPCLSQTGLQEGDACDRQTDDTTVPLYVYYVIFGNYDFHFWNYVSVVAAKRFVAPTALYVIGNAHPRGYWWQRVLQDVRGLRFVYR